MNAVENQQDQILYLVTDENGRTFDRRQWGPGVTYQSIGDKPEHWIHVYESPLLAALCVPDVPQLWEGQGKIAFYFGKFKACLEFTTGHSIPVPQVTLEQRVKFALHCTLAVYSEPRYVEWATNWINGVDRTMDSASAMAHITSTSWYDAPTIMIRAANRAAMAVVWSMTEGLEKWTAREVAQAVQMAARSEYLDLVSLAQKALES